MFPWVILTFRSERVGYTMRLNSFAEFMRENFLPLANAVATQSEDAKTFHGTLSKLSCNKIW